MNGKDTPRHDDILNDLRQKKQKNKKVYVELLKAIGEVFYCKDPSEVYPVYKNKLKVFKQGLPTESILKVVKWLFIEQDIRFWSWSGRRMFKEGIDNI
ncbi:MAG: hypothetical protein L6416_04565, partial [Candidatus Omnitrophica bacterium]|nr:hypothetical protein [Candidatus Omnitrophota bacterium]